jgi:hypothetical protein
LLPNKRIFVPGIRLDPPLAGITDKIFILSFP